ncbi:flagellar motor switch protein FliG [Litorisediminicola beolgyonensis]|uniref:Flagellar motor switch protein FliG n=1 Tax=Litorisediminicola beolgyonensis TaxID=1173614 RepID=A0ABW3ZFH7_9RHOB
MTSLTRYDAASEPAPPPPHRPATLSRKAKAAIVVQFLLNEGAEVPLSALPDALQAELTQQLGRMRYINRATLDAVMREFADELDAVGLSFPGDIAGALSVLDGRISAQTAQRLRKEAGVRQLGDPWERIAKIDLDRLRTMIESESTEVAAVVLSKLEVSRAAELLGKLPGTKARKITYAVAKTAGVTPEVVDRIGLSLASQLDSDPPRAFAARPVERVGAILNFSSNLTRDDLLTGLDETDEDFAQAVRRAIFTFSNLPQRVDPLDIPAIVRDVDAATLRTALAGATEADDIAAAEFLLGGLSKRMAQSLRDEVAEAGTITPADCDAAQKQVILAIRRLADAGELQLRAPEQSTR